MSKNEQDCLKHQIQQSMGEMGTEDLLNIWDENNHDTWSDLAFEVIGEILQKRLGKVPPQNSTRMTDLKSRTKEKTKNSINENSVGSNELIELLNEQNETLSEIRTFMDESLIFNGNRVDESSFRISVKDIADIPILSMMVFMLKWFVASLPFCLLYSGLLFVLFFIYFQLFQV